MSRLDEIKKRLAARESVSKVSHSHQAIAEARGNFHLHAEADIQWLIEEVEDLRSSHDYMTTQLEKARVEIAARKAGLEKAWQVIRELAALRGGKTND